MRGYDIGTAGAIDHRRKQDGESGESGYENSVAHAAANLHGLGQRIVAEILKGLKGDLPAANGVATN